MTIAEIYESMEYGPAPESAELAKAWLDAHDGEFGLFIGGKWHAAAGGRFATFSPGTGSKIAEIGLATSNDVDSAVSAARGALEGWQSLSGFERSKFLYALARQIQKHSRLFAVLESLDNGKPIRETRDIDIPLVARHFYHHAGWAQLRDHEFGGYQPVGVCGQIIPWNFPLLMLAWKIAPALAMGNTVILKPAEFTSLTALLFAEICEAVGLPQGVVNIITGDGSTGKAMVEHVGIDKIAFTGSTEVGRILRTATAGTGKKLSLELGGKSPFIVFEDADMDSAIEGLVDAIWFNQGQVCCAGSRLLVQEGVANEFLRRLRLRMDTLRVGDPLDKAVDIGAIIDPTQLSRIDSLVKQGVADGAECYQPAISCDSGGWFYPPTLLANVAPASTVAQVEIFGPVLVAMTFRTPAEAVELANNSVYGLASSIWTENLSLAHDVASKVKAGAVWINCTNQFDASAGFGGYRESGFGREGGREGLYEYLRAKSEPAGKPIEPWVPKHSEVDVTHKQFIGGKQKRPDGGYSIGVDGNEVSRGNRKDVRDAVEAARSAAKAWGATSGHSRAQILYYIGENLATHLGTESEEVRLAVELCFAYAGWADKFDGLVHDAPFRGLIYTRNEPIGVVGLICPPSPGLLAFLGMVLPCIAMGNAVVAIPSETEPFGAVELYRVLDSSDVPAGVVNIVTGLHNELEKTLAEHEDVDAVWHFGSSEGGSLTERLSTSNLKQTWCSLGKDVNWRTPNYPEFLRHATQVKNVWTPMGD